MFRDNVAHMVNSFFFFCIDIPVRITLQTLHAGSTLKRRGNGRFHVVSTWNPRGVFVG